MNLGINRNFSYNTSFTGIQGNIDYGKLRRSCSDRFINSLTANYYSLERSDVVDLNFEDGFDDGKYRPCLVLRKDVGNLKSGTIIRNLSKSECPYDTEYKKIILDVSDGHSSQKLNMRFGYSELVDSVIDKIPGVEKTEQYGESKVRVDSLASLGVLMTYAQQIEGPLKQIDKALNGR